MSSQLPQPEKSVAERVPDEIWREIFVEAIEPEYLVSSREITCAFGNAYRWEGPMNAVMNQAWSVPWVFLYVCAQWRRVILDQPQLWSHMKITIPSEQIIFPPAPSFFHLDWPAMIHRVLPRLFHLELFSLDLEPCLSTWRGVLAHQSNCRSLKLVFRLQKYLWNVAFTPTQLAGWTSLTSLDIEVVSAPGSETPRTIDLRGMSQLETYKERGGKDVYVTIILPLQSLRYIDLSLPRGYIAARLGAAPFLKRLRINVPEPSHWLTVNALGLGDHQMPNNPAYWPILEDLELVKCMFVLSFAEGSSLRSLSLKFPNDVTSFAARLPIVLSDSRLSLTALRIEGSLAWTDQGIRRSILELSSLQQLSIGFQLDADRVYAMIDSRFPPELWGNGLTVFLDEMLITSSLPPCPRLNSLGIDFSLIGEDISDSCMDWLLQQSKASLRFIGEALGKVWEARLVEHGSRAVPIDDCTLSIFAGGVHYRTISDVDLVIMNW